MPIQSVLATVIWSLVLAGSALAQSPFVELPLSPETAHAGSPAFALKISGTGFVNGSVVKWNGIPLATTFVSGRQIKGAVPASYVASPGQAEVLVMNPNGSISDTVQFEIGLAQTAVAFAPGPVPSFAPPEATLTADLNGDGKLDLVSIPYAQYPVASFNLGNGDGTFTTAGSWTGVPGYPLIAMTIADFNSDGKLDLAFVSRETKLPYNLAISILLGNGDGTFQPPSNPVLIADASPRGIVAGDFNGDGYPDVAVETRANYNDLYLFLGDGKGHLNGPTIYSTGGSGEAIGIGDFNNDGILDLVVGTDTASTGTVVLAGKGDGTFSPLSTITGATAATIQVADINNDGNQDLLLNHGAVYLNDGTGHFTAVTQYPDRGGILADMNGDRKLDLVAVTNYQAAPNTYQLGAYVALGNGDGTFTPAIFEFISPGTTDTYPTGWALGDFNGDGRPDVAIGVMYGDNVLGLQTPLQLSTSSVTFGLQTVGTMSLKQVVKLTDLSGKVELGQISITGPYAADYSFTTGCGAVLQVNQTCTIDVFFKPTAEGPRPATLSIVNATQNVTQTVSLNGNATAIHFSQQAINFGSVAVGHSASQNLTLSNFENYAINLAEIKFTKSAVGVFTETNNCSTTLNPGASCTVTVTFTPAAAGAASGDLLILDSAYHSPQAIPLSGTGN